MRQVTTQYNPEWGRFINVDGIVGEKGDLLGHNLFAYCKNNAVNFSDHASFRPTAGSYRLDEDFDTSSGDQLLKEY